MQEKLRIVYEPIRKLEGFFLADLFVISLENFLSHVNLTLSLKIL